MVPDCHFVKNSQVLVRNLPDIAAIKAVALSSVRPESIDASLVSAAKTECRRQGSVTPPVRRPPAVGALTSLVSSWLIKKHEARAKRASENEVGRQVDRPAEIHFI
jgi:hypothetical protein